MYQHLAIVGVVIWLAATLGLRLAGQHVLRPGRPGETALLLAVSIPASAFAVRWLCRRVGLPREQWITGTVILLLPTLLLDPYVSAFFPAVFPNIDPQMGGAFGGWMLCCCAGGLLGTVAEWRRFG